MYLLTFREFSREEFYTQADIWGTVYNNFFMYFSSGQVAEWKREEDVFRRFEREQPALEKELREGITQATIEKKGIGTHKILRPFNQRLYTAYRIMKSYGATDNELFA